MKILHILPSLHTGGAERLIIDSIPLYKKEINTVDVLLFNGANTPLKDELKKLGCNIISLGINVFNPFYIFKIRKYLKNYDLLHVHLFPCLYFVALAHFLFRSKTPIVYTEHSTHNKRRDKTYFKHIEKFIYRQYNQIIAISNQTRNNLLIWIGDNYTKKIRVVENGVNIQRFNQATELDRRSFNIGLNTKIILMVSRFSPQKDHTTLIKAFKRLTNINSTLILAGDGPLRQEVEKLVIDLELENKVLFLGVRMDIPNIVKTADICVLSSNWEGFGLVAVEAMAAKKPLIASDVPGLKDIVEGAGLLFPYQDEVTLANQITHLLSDQKYYDKIANACYIRSQEYDIKTMVEKYISIYNDIMKNHA